ncbi:YkgJ family cysteine cluster protein [Candidatus Woesearchaeota archaeon]|nr:YkgJ family cysteine cluster protein [Candidatus Woesearchaeota archaeon]
MDAETVANKARKAISRFCIDECRSFCCRKGYLVMTGKEADSVLQGRRTELQEKQIVTVCTSGKYSMNMGAIETGCPSLNEYTCMIHKKKSRPDTCRQFPIFIEGNTVKLSSRCLAVKTGMLYPYVYKLRTMGYKIEEGNTYSDSNI